MIRILGIGLAIVSILGLPRIVFSQWYYHIPETLEYIQNRNILGDDDVIYAQAVSSCQSPGLYRTFPFIGKAMHKAGAGWCDFWRYGESETADESLINFFPSHCFPIGGAPSDQHQTLCFQEFCLTDANWPFALADNGGSARWGRPSSDDEPIGAGWIILWENRQPGSRIYYTCAVMFVLQDQEENQTDAEVAITGIVHLYNYSYDRMTHHVSTTIGAIDNLLGIPSSPYFSRVIIKPVGCSSVPQVRSDIVPSRKGGNR